MKQILIFSFIILIFPLLVASTGQQVYIVYFGLHSGEKTHDEIEEHHHSYLFSLKDSKEEAKSSLLYSYKNSINGFAAVLTSDEALKLSELDEVISVFPSKANHLHTTRSWEFLGLSEGEKMNVANKNELWEKAGYGKQMIIGLLDTGIWPESESFSDEGMEPIPKSWKGICQEGDAFNSSHCNKKIIGARYYLKGFEKQYGPLNQTMAYKSARDNEGHGTHTSSIVGGRFVHAEVTGGFANGTASGGAPLAHLAMYKVCWPVPQGQTVEGSCFDEDILAAFDDAVGDGVDILSISVGGLTQHDYANDSIAIGSLHAVQNNIVIVSGAGNFGISDSSVSNAAPWIFTVGASSIDRDFCATLLLGNGMTIPGKTLTPYKLEEKMYPLVFAKDIEEVPENSTGNCGPGSLSPEKTKGKIVVCVGWDTDTISVGKEVKRASGAGLVLGNSVVYGEEISVDAHVLPATAVGYISAQKVLKYINSTQNPTAYINPARTALNVKPAPQVGSFSGRGPNAFTLDILKPDITAPGINILGAWIGASQYSLQTGTSMACPHVAAVAGLIKAIHPTWSSAAIRSAIMTTAVQTDNMKMPITDDTGVRAGPFQYGSGHIHPTRAVDPGLIYDASYTDYLLFLCDRNGKTLNKSFICPPDLPLSSNLNYPSLAISKLNGTVTVKRVVTNVGNNSTTYVSQVEAPPGVSIKVFPPRLEFHRVGEKKQFTITIEANKSKAKKNENADDCVFGWYSWSDEIHVVHSPVAINVA